MLISDVMVGLQAYYFEGLHKAVIAIGVVVILGLLVVGRIVFTKRRAQRRAERHARADAGAGARRDHRS